MVIKLESNLEHQLKPIMGVAEVVEASIAPEKPRLSVRKMKIWLLR